MSADPPSTDSPSTRTPRPTQREKERRREERDFQPVIIKRSDQTTRHADDTLQFAIEEGLEQLERTPLSLALASMAAGLLLTFTVMAVAVMYGLHIDADPGYRRAMGALVYPLGFIIVILSGNELFTEHTATAVYPVLEGRASVRTLLQLWGMVLGGNLIGAVLGAILLVLAEPVIGAQGGYALLGHHLVHFDPVPLFISAMLAGWLMATAAWLVLSTPPNMVQMLSIYICTALIGLGGLHHSIAGAIEVFTAAMFDPASFPLGVILEFEVLAVLGNMVGGALFVAALNYAHIRGTRRQQRT